MLLSIPKIDFACLALFYFKKNKRFSYEEIEKNSKTPIIFDEEKYEYVQREYDSGMYEGMLDKNGCLSGIGRFVNRESQ